MQDSIYQSICARAAENPDLPYCFQDPLIHGGRDAHYIFDYDALPVTDQQMHALEVMELAAAHLTDSSDELGQYLVRYPLCRYIVWLAARIRLLIAEKLIDDTQLYEFGLMLATQRINEEEVKLGILILGFYENDITRRIITVLGLHSALTIAAVQAAEQFTGCNEFLFYLLQNTCGYGKLFALQHFEPVHPSQQFWLFEYGARNEALPNLSAIICLEKADMAAFYRNLVLTKSNFSKLSFLLAYAAEKSSIWEFAQSPMVFEKYIDAAGLLAQSFIDFAALAAIKTSIYSTFDNTQDEDGWQYDYDEDELALYEKCCSLTARKKWKKLVLAEMAAPVHTTSLIILALKETGAVPGFVLFVELLRRDPFDMDLLGFLLARNGSFYCADVMKYLDRSAPDDVLASNPQQMTQTRLDPEYKADVWYVFLLRALRKYRRYEESLLLQCLTARFPDIRNEAIHGLRRYRSNWSPNVADTIAHAIEAEPDEQIAERLKQLKDINTEPEKEQRYIDITGIEVSASPFDTCVLETEIAGTAYRDLSVVAGLIHRGDILFLQREPDNKYDRKAIMVTADDGYLLGYVPRVDNPELAGMMDNGEKLYAVLACTGVEYFEPSISIMLCRPFPSGKNIVDLPQS